MAHGDQLNTTERIYEFDIVSTEKGVREHLDRYRFALTRLAGSEAVLDAACGSGYGTKMLRSRARRVVGVEVSDHALAYAADHYAGEGIAYQKADLRSLLPFPSDTFDMVVSFETIEHLIEQEALLGEFRRLLRPGGTLLISTPDKNIISGGLPSDNPYHLKELTKGEFLDLLKRFFTIEGVWGQGKVTVLPAWKTALKRLRRISFLRKGKQALIRWLGLEKLVHAHFAAEAYSPLEPLDQSAVNPGYYVIVAACRKAL